MSLPEKLLQAIKNGNVRKFYKSAVWKHKRHDILQRDNFECQRCKERGEYSEAEVVHHIKHLREYPQLALVDDNLKSLCASCHNEVHPEKLNKYRVEEKDFITPERW